MANTNKNIDPFVNIPQSPEAASGEEDTYLNKVKEFQVGFGSKVMRSDRRGLWLGGEDPSTAPFHVDMEGNVKVTSLSALTGFTDSDLTAVALPDDGVRVDSNGIYGRKNGATTFTLTSAGDATFTGTITGSLFKTADTGERIEIDTTNTNQIRFYDSSDLIGAVEVSKTGSSGFLKVTSPDGGGLVVDYDVGSSSLNSAQVVAGGGTLHTTGTSSVGVVGMYRTSSADEYFHINRSGGVTTVQTDLDVELKGSSLVFEETGAGTDTITLVAPSSIGSSYTLTLPTDDGNNGDVLQTDGSGGLSWGSASSGANTSLSNLSAVAVNTDIDPDADNTHDLGNASDNWRNIYVGNVRLRTNEGDIYYSGSIALQFFASRIELGSSYDEFSPDSAISANLGDSSRRWNTTYTDTLDVNSVTGTDGTMRFDLSGRLQVTNHLDPQGAGSLNLGGSSRYWNDVSYKTLTDRGCLGWYDGGVEMRDGRVVSDLEALREIRKHPTKRTPRGAPRLDYATLPKHVYTQAADHEGNLLPRDRNDEPYVEEIDPDTGKTVRVKAEDGAELTAFISILFGSIKELEARVSDLEAGDTSQG